MTPEEIGECESARAALGYADMACDRLSSELQSRILVLDATDEALKEYKSHLSVAHGEAEQATAFYHSYGDGRHPEEADAAQAKMNVANARHSSAQHSVDAETNKHVGAQQAKTATEEALTSARKHQSSCAASVSRACH